LGDQSVDVNVQDWGGFVGQWDTRLWRESPAPIPPEPAAGDMSSAANRARRIRAAAARHEPVMQTEFAGLLPGYIKTSPIAWFVDHHHDSDGQNEEYAYSYLYAYAIPLPAGAKTLTLPGDAQRVRILAVSVAHQPDVQPAQALYDVENRSAVATGFYGLK